jgi:hypothetical protein
VTAHGDQIVVAGSDGSLHGLDVVRGYEAWQATGLGQVTALASGPDAVWAGTDEGRVVRIFPGGVGS